MRRTHALIVSLFIPIVLFIFILTNMPLAAAVSSESAALGSGDHDQDAASAAPDRMQPVSPAEPNEEIAGKPQSGTAGLYSGNSGDFIYGRSDRGLDGIAPAGNVSLEDESRPSQQYLEWRRLGYPQPDLPETPQPGSISVNMGQPERQIDAMAQVSVDSRSPLSQRVPEDFNGDYTRNQQDPYRMDHEKQPALQGRIEAPSLDPSLVLSLTLSPLHRSSNNPGSSSTFVITNTSVSAANYAMDFYWLNGEYVGTDNQVLGPGASLNYAMDSAPFGETTFYGYVEISSDQDFIGNITSPDYGAIQGIVVQPDGVTPQQIWNLDVNRQSDGEWYGGSYNLSDGRFYLGGLPDDNFIVQAHTGYPWATQWWDRKPWMDQADTINISGAGSPFITVTLEAGGMISGTVFDATGLVPLENVNVDVNGGGFGTCTDANGHFQIEGLPYGEYRVHAGSSWNWCLEAPSTYAIEFFEETPDYNLATVIPISSTNDVVSGIDFTLDPAGMITGTVYSEDGQFPLENVNVDVDLGGFGACTDANGQYTIGGLPFGDYKVYAGGGWNWCLDQQSAFISEWYSETGDYNLATILTLSDTNDLIQNIDFTLSSGGMITGYVRAASDGTPLEGVRVEANDYNSDEYFQDGWSDSSGYYEISGLPDGDFRVGVRDTNWIPLGYAFQYYSATVYWDQATPVNISGSGTVQDINFNLEPGGVITGQVVDQDSGVPLANMTVGLNPWEEGWGHGTCTDDSGLYVLNGVPYGDYRVKAGGGWNDCLQEPNTHALEYYSETISYDAATPVTLDSGQDYVEGINFTLEPGGIITGTVIDAESGSPLEGINISVSRADQQPFGEGQCSEADGSFVFYGLPYADYIISAGEDWNWCLEEPSIYLTEYYSEAHFYDQATPVTLDAGTTPVGNLLFTMDFGGSITGQVTASDSGLPLADVRVQASTYDDEWYWRGAWTNASGFYTITGLFDEDYRLRIDDENGIPPGFAQQYWPYTFAHHLAARVTISAGVHLTGYDFALEAGGTITGWITDQETGQPLENINVSAGIDGGGGGRGSCSGQDGYYELNLLIYADYIVEAGGDWNWCLNEPSAYMREYYSDTASYNEATPVTLDGGSTLVSNINFSLETGGYIGGNVQDTTLVEAPVEGVRMVAIVPGDENCPWCAEWLADGYTNSSGDYIIGPLPSGQYVVKAHTYDGTGIPLASEFYGDVYFIDQATAITVSNALTTTGVNFLLDTGVLIDGIVTVPPGYTSQDMPVDVWISDGPFWGERINTDPSGYYAIHVPPVFDSLWGVGPRPEGTDLEFQWAHRFDLAQNTSWDFDLGIGGVITGHVTSGGFPVQDVYVSADSDFDSHGSGTDANGYFEITNLPAASYRLWADKSPEYAFTYYRENDNDWETPVILNQAEIFGGADFDILPLGGIEGYLFESNGTTPVEGAEIFAVGDIGYWNGFSQVDGYFFIDLPVGDYKIFAQHQDFSEFAAIYYDGAHTYADAQTVSVGPLSGGSTYLELQMEHRGTLSGQVVDGDTLVPLGGIHVVAELTDPLVGLVEAGYSCTDEFGNYFIEGLRAGETRVTAVGTCGAYAYGPVTDTLIVLEGVDHSLNLTVTAGTTPQWPLTVHANESFDYTPLSSLGSVGLSDADQILPALFAPLLQLDDQGEWYPELITQVPTEANGGVVISGDRLVVTYTLKPGLKWSDGMPLTSADIHFTWQFMAITQPKADGYVQSVSAFSKIADVLTPDPQTAVLVYQRGHRPPDYLAAMTYLLPEHILSGEHPMDVRWNSQYAHYPIGNGPYKVAEWLPGSHLTLQVNPHYHKYNPLIPVPKTSSIRFLFTDDPFWSLLSGAADVSLGVTGSLPPDYSSYDLDVYQNASWGFGAWIPNNELPFFQDVLVRRALYQALDRESWADEFGPGTILGDSWLPENHPMFTDVITRYDYNLAAAASLLDAAGWVDTNGNGIRDKDGVEFEFNLHYPEGSGIRESLALRFQNDLASIGVDANLIAAPWEEILDNGRRGLLDVFTVGWGFDSRYDPTGYQLFHSRSTPTAYSSYNGSYFTGRWSDPLNDSLMEAAFSELDSVALRDLYSQQIALFSDQVPIWVTRNYGRHDAVTPILVGFKPAQHTPVTWNIEQWLLPDNPHDLSVRKSLAADSPSPQPDTTITYTLDVRNAGFFTVHNGILVDDLPPLVSFVDATPYPSTISDGQLTWNLGDIEAGASYPSIRLAVHIPVTVTQGTELVNHAQVYADESDSRPSNNAFIHQLTVSDEVDLEVMKSGVGQPAVGEQFVYLIDYANWGGAPASGVVLTDTLPPEVSLLDAVPAPSGSVGPVLTWTLPTLQGNQWGGQIELTAEITETGLATNTAYIDFGDIDVDYSNNIDSHVEDVDDILAPLLQRPTRGTTDGTPTLMGLAASNAVVDIYDLSLATWVISTTATPSGTFEIELNLAEGSYILAATATKAGLTSGYSNAASINVDHGLPLDPDYINITVDGVDLSMGSVRAQQRILSRRLLDVETVLSCPNQPLARLMVTENGLNTYNVLPTNVSDLGSELWQSDFQFYLGDPHNTYEVWIEWDCDDGLGEGVNTFLELLLTIIIDPDGYVYDQSMVNAGSTISDSLVYNAVVTAYIKIDNSWQIWPATIYGQTNPQSTDGSVDDGVLEPGYYSFLTPSGKYRLEVGAPGYQPYMSPIITVITTPVHLDIGLAPTVGGSGQTLSPANLANSFKSVDRQFAWVGEELVYDIWLDNSGQLDTGALSLVDSIPANTEYVPGSLGWDTGSAGYDFAQNQIWWNGMVPAGESAHMTFAVQVVETPGVPFDIVNQASVSGPPGNVASLPELSAATTIQNIVGIDLQGNEAGSALPGETITYSHWMTNTGNFTDTYSANAVSGQGWPVLLDLQQTLGPGESSPVSVELQIPEGSISGTMDQITITVASDTASGTFSQVVDTTTVERLIDLSLSADGAQNGDPGQVIDYQHDLENTGNYTDTFWLEAQSSEGWSVSVVSPTVTLAPNDSATIEVAVTIPADALSGTVDHTAVLAWSEADANVTATVTDTTTVNQVASVALTPDLASDGNPGQVVTYSHMIENLGNGSDTFSFSAQSSEGWIANVPSPVTLDPGESAQVVLEVEVPADATAGIVDSTMFTATSAFDNGVTASVTDETTVNQVAALTLSAADPQTAEPGATVVYQHTLVNTGNGSDTFILSAVSSQDWLVITSPDPTLAAGESITILITVTVPADAADGLVDTTTLTVRSSFDPSVTGDVLDITTVEMSNYVVLIPVILKPQ